MCCIKSVMNYGKLRLVQHGRERLEIFALK